MNIHEIIKSRKSVRAFSDKEIPEDIIHRILESARLAPSAKNRQEWRFIIVSDKKNKELISVAAKNQHFIKDAPIVLACCGIDDGYVMGCGQPAYSMDVTIAIDHITLCATAEGLGTCWIGAFDENKVKEILDIPKKIRVVQLLPIGYPIDNTIKDKKRLPITDIVKYEKWN